MKILLVEDCETIRNKIKKELEKDNKFKVQETGTGYGALKNVKDEEIKIVLLDWELPDIDGIKVLRFLRKMKRDTYLYIIMLTGRNNKNDLIEGLGNGADDYIKKPFDMDELIARINVGQRIIQLYEKVKEKIFALEKSLKEIKTLKGLLPICSYCKSIRLDENYWQKLESYLSKNTDLKITHGICPECHKKFVKPYLGKQKIKKFGKIN